MRAADVFTAGMIAGAVVVLLWGKEIRDFLEERPRPARPKAADAIGTVKGKVRA